jgi:hypothetical protein
MNICFISQNGHLGKLPRNFENCRVEFAWQIALNADHLSFDYICKNKVQSYDLVIIILPKKLELININQVLDICKSIGKKITVMQEGPCWYYQDYKYEDQVNYINFLNEMDFLLVHNKSDITYFKGIFKKPTFSLQSVMIEDTVKNIINKNSGCPIIGGNFCSWYGGVDSYFVARNFNKDIYIPSMGRKIVNEENFPNLKHLPYMQWTQWVHTLSQFNVGIHLMRTHAAGTFALNCAYLGIPCIGYKGLDTQQILHPLLTVDIGDIDKANELVIRLRDDLEFYNNCSFHSKELYQIYYTEEKWLQNWNKIHEQIKD